MNTPTRRSLVHLRDVENVAFVQVVERWNSFAKRRVDLFGVVDIVALAFDRSVEVKKDGRKKRFGMFSLVGIQATSRANHASRVAKVLGEPAAWNWLMSGARIEVWSWGKEGPRGKRKRWTLKISRFGLSNAKHREVIVTSTRTISPFTREEA